MKTNLSANSEVGNTWFFFLVKLFKHRKMYKKQCNSCLLRKNVIYVSNTILLKVTTGQPVDQNL